MPGNDMMLDDLNIVAIPATPKSVVTPKKRKKNNKYERRRQKSKTAKQQKDEQRREDHELSHHEQPGSKENGQDHQDVIESIQVEDKRDSPTMKSDSGNDLPPDQSNTIGTNLNERKEDAKQKQKWVTTDSFPSNQGTLNRPRINQMTEYPSASATNKEKRHSKFSLEDEEERAKYMAEFHARPMELDRRSGARPTKFTVVSKESKHIFDDDTQINDWKSLNLHTRLIQTLQSSQFNNLQQPTTIQSRTIRAFQKSNEDNSNDRKNILIHSETGSGKTLAYLLPILQSMAYGMSDNDQQTERKRISRSDMGCRCLILCPTRELANQTLQVLERICQTNFAGWIVPGGLLGGDKRHSEKSRLRKGLAIIVATPGRLLDHLHKTQCLALNLKGKLQWLVLDEADRLLDMGLGDQVRQIVQWIRANEASKLQLWRSVLVSATVTPSVQALAKEKMLCGNQEWISIKGDNDAKKNNSAAHDADLQEIGDEEADESVKENYGTDAALSENYSSSTPRQLAQYHLTVTAKLRLSSLISFLVQRVSKNERTVVFMGTCASVDYHYELFSSLEESLWDDEQKSSDGNTDTKRTAVGLFGKKARLFKLHGSVLHAKRIQTMKDFKNSSKEATILLTTDVAARGLNLDGTDWTVQYDPPCEVADYVHRIGRAARAGNAGHSLLFLLPSERRYLEVLEMKGIKSLNPLSLSSLLNQAAENCSKWTRTGQEYSGSGGVNVSKTSRISNSSRLGEFFSSEVQRRLEDCVTKDDLRTKKVWKESLRRNEEKQKGNHGGKDRRKEGQLLAMARDAFVSFMRAYSTKKEPVVRSIFSSRALHLGHVAKSFALKEPPKSSVSKHKSKRRQNEDQIQDKQTNMPRSLQFGDAPFDIDQSLDEAENHRFSNNTYDSDVEEEGGRVNKRQELQQNGKPKNAKALLLANATKLENNLMDAL